MKHQHFINCTAAVNHTGLRRLWELLPKHSPVGITAVWIGSSRVSLIAGLQHFNTFQSGPSLLIKGWSVNLHKLVQQRCEQSAGNHFRG